jgi:hypothetical protein
MAQEQLGGRVEMEGAFTGARGSNVQGRTTYITLTRMLGIQERTNNLCLYPGLEHAVLASSASLDEIHNPILLDAVNHPGSFDDSES